MEAMLQDFEKLIQEEGHSADFDFMQDHIT